jgi:hypothetical protein
MRCGKPAFMHLISIIAAISDFTDPAIVGRSCVACAKWLEALGLGKYPGLGSYEPFSRADAVGGGLPTDTGGIG